MSEIPDDVERWPEHAQQILDRINLRNHRVNLERVQRIHLGIDDEEMEFSEETIARMIDDVAANCDENEAFTLCAISAALRGDDPYHRLQLKQKKPGRFENPTEHARKFNRNFMWLHTIAELELSGVKTESAIAEVADAAGVSRATVFAGLKDAEDFLQSGAELFPGNDAFTNPRPAKNNID